MKNISDERLEKMLTNYCEADCGQSFAYHPEQKKEKVIPFIRLNKAVLAAASLVLVSVLSMTVYIIFGNKVSTPIAVAPSKQSASAPSAPTGESGGDSIQQGGTVEPTQGQSLIQKIISGLFPDLAERTNAPSANVPPTEKKNTAPTAPSNKSTVKPSANATEKPLPKPTEQPVTQPTEKLVIGSTESEYEPTTYVPPTDPQMPPWNDDPDPPTEGGEPGIQIPSPVELYGSFDSSRLPADYNIYCKIYDDSGKLLGDRDLYASGHFAEIARITEASVLVVYTAPEGMIESTGYYNYVFYDSRGMLLTQGQEYIEV